jgi:hypothetical protein
MDIFAFFVSRWCACIISKVLFGYCDIQFLNWQQVKESNKLNLRTWYMIFFDKGIKEDVC